jgi:hypothetical protein
MLSRLALSPRRPVVLASPCRSLKSCGRLGDLDPVSRDRAKVVVARAIALLVAAGFFLFSEFAQRPGVSPFGEPTTSVVVAVALWSSLAWAALAIGPWHRLADAISWWPGREPHNLFGLAALISGVLAASGLLFGGVFLVGCIALAFNHRLSSGWVLAAVIALALGVFGMWASPRAQARARDRDTERAG